MNPEDILDRANAVAAVTAQANDAAQSFAHDLGGGGIAEALSAATGGVVGIGYWDAAVCDTSPASVAKAMKHVRDLVGIEHVALGSDYDGATTVRFDTSKLVQVTEALIEAGFTDDEIRAAMGGNAIRVLRAGLVPLTPPPAVAPAP